MYFATSISFLLCLSISSGWYFTDVDYNRIRREFDPDYINEVDPDDIDPRISLIYPGTKWCGAGTSAENYDDLGSQRETDMCCRDHDNCPDLIASGESKHGLNNNAYYTRLHCSCDERFRTCLHNSNNTGSAGRIGTLYFNTLHTKCYRKDYPVIGCRKHVGWLRRKCLEPIYNTSAEPQYQWFDVPNY